MKILKMISDFFSRPKLTTSNQKQSTNCKFLVKTKNPRIFRGESTMAGLYVWMVRANDFDEAFSTCRRLHPDQIPISARKVLSMSPRELSEPVQYVPEKGGLS